MKKTIGSAILALSLVGSGAALAKQASATLSVSGWHCGGCSSKTEAALKKVKGVKTAMANTDSKTVTVSYDDKQTNEAALVAAVKDLGYTVETAKAAPAAPAAPAPEKKETKKN